MEKAMRMGKTSATGSFHLFMGQTISTVIMAVGTVILGILMLEEEYGLYAFTLIPIQMISLFRDWGVNSALTKFTAEFRSSNKDSQIRNIITAGVTFQIATGLLLTLISLSLANIIASTVFQEPQLGSLISVSSISIFSGALFMASQSIFMGFERMELASLTMIAHAILKTVAAPILVYLGYGVLGAILGNTFASLTAGLIAIAILYLIFFRKLVKANNDNSGITENLKIMLQYGIPLSIYTIVIGFHTHFYHFIMAYYCGPILMGNYRITTNFNVLITFVTIPIAQVLFPTFAKINPKKEPQLLKNIFTSSVKYTSLFLVPTTMAIMVLSQPMIRTLFGDKWNHAPFFLTLLASNFLLAVSGRLSMSQLLTGLGRTKMLMKLGLLTLFVSIPLALILIPTRGIVGAIIGLIISNLPSMFLGLHWVWKQYEVKADFQSSTRILLASAISAFITYMVTYFLDTAAWIQLALGGTTFIVTYLISAPLLRAVNKEDINNLKTMFSGLGVISKIINIPLKIAEKATDLFHK